MHVDCAGGGNRSTIEPRGHWPRRSADRLRRSGAFHGRPELRGADNLAGDRRAAATLVALNDGQPTTWVLRRIRTDATPEPSSSTIPEANFNPLEVRIEQNGTVLSGSNRDSGREVDVTVSGSVDADGKVDLTITLTNSGSPRQVIEIKNARVTGDGANQTIKGKYEATGPGAAETGNFEMTHN
jgi:hypothetical protein